jgi:hypothetical protein
VKPSARARARLAHRIVNWTFMDEFSFVVLKRYRQSISSACCEKFLTRSG